MHRALGDPSRWRLLDLLEHEGPLGVQELADRSGLHQNTVRAHLEVLAEAGLVASSLESRSTPGRPRRLFTALPRSEEREHELLAAAFAGLLEPLADGAQLARASGRSWGSCLVERLPPTVEPDEEGTVSHLVDLLARRGFAPEREGRTVAMCRCPFQELAERYPAVVCGFHAGLVDGALEGVGSPLRVGELRPWVGPSRCEARLVPREGPAAPP